MTSPFDTPFTDSPDYAPIDRQFASLVTRHCHTGSDTALLAVAAATALRSVRNSQSCLDLARWCAGKDYPATLPADAEAWRAVLADYPDAVGAPGRDATPLILEDDRLYLQRYYRSEVRLTRRIRAVTAPLQAPADDNARTEELIRSICRHFTGESLAANRQMQAAATALSSPFTVITGGPGTGKTTVTAVILALLLRQHPGWKVALAAPTGKAAARMKESLSDALAHSLTGIEAPLQKRLDSLLPSTIHRLIGINETTGLPLHNHEAPIEADLVVIDECSMVSLLLFDFLLDAIPPQAAVILLGDKNQLSSVESGVVFGEICGYLSAHSPRQLCVLTENHRSRNNPALCAFANAIVSAGDIRPDYGALFAGNSPQPSAFRRLPLERGSLENALRQALTACHIDPGQWSAPATLAQARQFSDSFKILCAIRQGKFGVVNLNSVMCKVLKMTPERYPGGMPVIVLENDSQTGLSNGDVGVCFNGRVHFQDQSFSPVELPPHECAFAMTIHKSQGSDADNILMVLPNHPVPILTRELIYTGITRTKRNFFMICEDSDCENAETLFRRACQNKIHRWSGLSMLLERPQP